jgi:uncharacterized SAM-binding protein YcdF (DUF218 family)
MKFPALFRRRSLVLPTLTGWLLILLVCGLGALYLFQGIADFLTVNEPVDADYLVIEGWMNKDELDQSLDYFNSGDYRLAIVVGGPIDNDFQGIDTSFAKRAADYLRGQGLAEEQSVVIETPYSAQDRTFLNAVMTREWFARQGIEPSRLDVFSSTVHTRRSRHLYQLAFGDEVNVGVIPSHPADFDSAHWWRTSDSGKNVAIEFAGWLLVKCCFFPGESGSHLEKWGIEKSPGNGG